MWSSLWISSVQIPHWLSAAWWEASPSHPLPLVRPDEVDRLFEMVAIRSILGFEVVKFYLTPAK